MISERVCLLLVWKQGERFFRQPTTTGRIVGATKGGHWRIAINGRYDSYRGIMTNRVSLPIQGRFLGSLPRATRVLLFQWRGCVHDIISDLSIVFWER